MKAVRRFDPERGVRLVSFALHWIQAEIHEYILRNWRLVKVATTKAQRKLFFNLRSMKTSSARADADRGAGDRADLGVKPEEVVEMETRLSGRDIALDPHAGRRRRLVSPIAYLTDTEDEPAQILERAADRDATAARACSTALAKLDDRSRRIIEARWLREDDPATLQDLADEYGVSAERIRQIESKAMKTMRGADGRAGLIDRRRPRPRRDAGLVAGVFVCRAAAARVPTLPRARPASRARRRGWSGCWKKSVALTAFFDIDDEQPLAPQRHARRRRSAISVSRDTKNDVSIMSNAKPRAPGMPRAAPARRGPP